MMQVLVESLKRDMVETAIRGLKWFWRCLANHPVAATTVVVTAVVGAVLAVASAVSAHRTHVQPFGPELAHKQYVTPASLSPPSSWNSFVSHCNDDVFFTGSAVNPQRVALDFVEQKLTDSEYIVKNAYTSKHNGVTHVYLRQRIDGLEVINGDINVNVDKHGNVISYGDSFYKGDRKKSSSIKEWIKKEAESLQEQGRQFTYNRWRLRPQVTSEPKGTMSPLDALLSLARYLNVEIPRPEDMDIVATTSIRSDKVEVVMTNCPLTENGKVPVAQAYIQTADGDLELVYDFQVEMDTDNWFHVQVHAETGKVMQVVDWVADATYNVYPMGINDPEEGDRKLVKDPHHLPASPLGWNRQGQNKNFTTTVGNNVYAGDNRRNGNDWQNNPKPEGVIDENGELVFDFKIDLDKDTLTYIDAAESGNFQENNFDRGGLGNDVIVNAQDTTTLCACPNSGCLGWGVAGGMGEGWGDFFGTMFRQKKHHDYNSEFSMGSYSNGGN
ncbi:Fungalysin/Thermolysin Extracellular metalloproteinase 5, partial [Modicella reniformis]